MKESLNIVIAGATGYVGIELIKILCKHPKANITYLCASKSIGKTIKSFDKSIKKKLPKISNLKNVNWDKVNIIFTKLTNKIVTPIYCSLSFDIGCNKKIW